jgi:hypothetical protein
MNGYLGASSMKGCSEGVSTLLFNGIRSNGVVDFGWLGKALGYWGDLSYRPPRLNREGGGGT